MSKCLLFTDDLVGFHSTPFYVNDYALANLEQKRILVKSDPELDDYGNTIGDAIGLSTAASVAVAHKNLYRAFGIEYMVYQNGPLAANFHDNTGMMRGTVVGPFNGPQAVRRFMATYHPNGIGLINLFGPPIGVEEGVVVRICPIGESLGDNPLWDSEKLIGALLQAKKSRGAN